MVVKVGWKQKSPIKLEDTFYCKARKKKTVFGDCLDDYVDANAFDKSRLACWRCPQGRFYRESFAE